MNYANADMVGHSGKLAPTIRACEAGRRRPGRDLQRSKTVRRFVAGDGRSRERRDHDRSGDARSAYLPHDESGTVSFMTNDRVTLREKGALEDVAPTVLGILAWRNRGR